MSVSQRPIRVHQTLATLYAWQFAALTRRSTAVSSVVAFFHPPSSLSIANAHSFNLCPSTSRRMQMTIAFDDSHEHVHRVVYTYTFHQWSPSYLVTVAIRKLAICPASWPLLIICSLYCIFLTKRFHIQIIIV